MQSNPTARAHALAAITKQTVTKPACGADMFARRVAIMGADGPNADTADPVPPEWMTRDPAVQPFQPWAADVMILAGSTEDDRPWLWLACRGCGWFLGFAAQYVPSVLARAAAEHDSGCKVLAARRAKASANETSPQINMGTGPVRPL